MGDTDTETYNNISKYVLKYISLNVMFVFLLQMENLHLMFTKRLCIMDAKEASRREMWILLLLLLRGKKKT